MKTLYLLRHAKAASDDSALDDRDRPLNDQGRAAAAIMAQYMKARAYQPDFVLCSSAVRCRQTLDAVTEHLGDLPVRVDDALYLAAPDALHRFVTELGPDIDRVLIIGHNPGIGEFARMFADPGDAHAADLAGNFPTGALAALTGTREWADIGAAPLQISDFVTPKMVE